MAGNPNPGSAEPVLKAAAVQAAVMGAINIIVALNIVVLTTEQLGVINASLGSILTVLLAVWARGKVSPL